MVVTSPTNWYDCIQLYIYIYRFRGIGGLHCTYMWEAVKKSRSLQFTESECAYCAADHAGKGGVAICSKAGTCYLLITVVCMWDQKWTTMIRDPPP